MKPGRVVVAAALVGMIGAGGWWFVKRTAKPALAVVPGTASDTMRLVPEGVRVKVEVLNASSERGLARRAMFYLRARGFDVVSMGNADRQSDTSVVIDRSGHPEWAAAAARALGKARIETKPDSSRYLDLTILLGAAFRAPPQIISP